MEFMLKFVSDPPLVYRDSFSFIVCSHCGCLEIFECCINKGYHSYVMWKTICYSFLFYSTTTVIVIILIKSLVLFYVGFLYCTVGYVFAVIYT